MTRFVVQIEYRTDRSWAEVVRFDHDPSTPGAHDLTAGGVHMDVYRTGEKIRVEELFPAMPASDALTFAEEHLGEHAERYIERFERWHGIHQGDG